MSFIDAQGVLEYVGIPIGELGSTLVQETVLLWNRRPPAPELTPRRIIRGRCQPPRTGA